MGAAVDQRVEKELCCEQENQSRKIIRRELLVCTDQQLRPTPSVGLKTRREGQASWTPGRGFCVERLENDSRCALSDEYGARSLASRESAQETGGRKSSWRRALAEGKEITRENESRAENAARAKSAADDLRGRNPKQKKNRSKR
jgi:hypothetical protein